MNAEPCKEIYREWYRKHVNPRSDAEAYLLYHLQKQLKGVEVTGKRVLEIGCGRGAVSLYLALHCNPSQVVALDEAAGEGSAVNVTEGLKKFVTQHSVANFDVRDVDFLRSGYPDGSFDLIIANNALHHFVDTSYLSDPVAAHREYQKLFLEISRVCSSDGLISIQEASRMCLWRWSPIKFKWRITEWDKHPTVAEWLRSMSDGGLKIERVDYWVPYGLRAMECILGNKAASCLLGSGFSVVASPLQPIPLTV